MARYRDPLTKDLFEWQPPTVAVGYSPEVTGRGRLDSRIARLVGQALRDARDAGRDRADVASRISDYLGRPVSEAMLNKWSSEAAEDHRIPLDAFIGLIEATEALDLLGFMPGLFGMAVIRDEYAELIRLQMIRDKRQELEAQERALEAKLRARR